MSSKFRSDIPTMNSANNVAKWKTGFIGHKKGIGPIFISEFADLFAAAHMYATRTYFFSRFELSILVQCRWKTNLP